MNGKTFLKLLAGGKLMEALTWPVEETEPETPEDLQATARIMMIEAAATLADAMRSFGCQACPAKSTADITGKCTLASLRACPRANALRAHKAAVEADDAAQKTAKK